MDLAMEHDIGLRECAGLRPVLENRVAEGFDGRTPTDS